MKEPQISRVLWNVTTELSGFLIYQDKGRNDPESGSEIDRAAIPTTGPKSVSSLFSLGQVAAPVGLAGRATTQVGPKHRASRDYSPILKSNGICPARFFTCLDPGLLFLSNFSLSE